MMIGSITLPARKHTTSLLLKDGSGWNISAEDGYASVVLSQLSAVMQLSRLVKPLPISRIAKIESPVFNISRQLLVLVNPSIKGLTTEVSSHNGTITCVIGLSQSANILAMRLVQLSGVIVADSEVRGGIVIHGALLERDGWGVILAGPGGVGKTTACHRILSPWTPLCDDTTLIVHDGQGSYWAHPWPTWSTFMFNGPGGSWDVQHAVPLKGIFFLEQAQKDEFEPLGIAQSVCLLNESTEQTQCFISSHSEKNELRRLRLLRFDNICALAQTVPSYVLRLGRNGAFWQEIELALYG